MKPRHILLAWVIPALLLVASNSEAKIYKCFDGEGIVSFQELTCDGYSAEQKGLDSKTRLEQKARQKHFLWRAVSGKTTLYLLGSLHFGIPDMYPLSSVIQQAYLRSDNLVVEVNMLKVDAQTAAQKISATGALPDGQTLDKILDSVTLARLSHVAGKLGIPIKILKRQKPWFAAMTLAVLGLQRSGYDARLGIDNYFMQLANEVKPVLELESMSQQLMLMDQLAPDVQVAMLVQSLAEFEQGAIYFRSLLGAWSSGDLDRMAALVSEGMDESKEGRALYDAFLTQRNLQMAEKLTAIMQPGKTYFVVVGAAHLVGSQGLIELLRDRGFRIQQQ